MYFIGTFTPSLSAQETVPLPILLALHYMLVVFFKQVWKEKKEEENRNG
jgi:hypothetical protein